MNCEIEGCHKVLSWRMVKASQAGHHQTLCIPHQREHNAIMYKDKPGLIELANKELDKYEIQD